MSSGPTQPVTFHVYRRGAFVRSETLTRDVIKIGRLPSAHLHLNDESVSRLHAVVEILSPSEIYLIDLGASEGSLVNGQRINKVLIHDGDELGFGDWRVVFAVGAVASPALDPVEVKFLDDIRQRPDDEATRLIYADWLEEQDALPRADFLRAQLAMSKLSGNEPEFGEVASRLQTLMPQTDLRWRVQVAQRRLENCTFVVKCPMRWEKLQPTANPAVRHCGGCQRDVHYCVTPDELRTRALEGACVAVDVSVPRAQGDLEVFPEAVMMAGALAPPEPFLQPPEVLPPPSEKPGVWSRLRRLFGSG